MCGDGGVGAYSWGVQLGSGTGARRGSVELVDRGRRVGIHETRLFNTFVRSSCNAAGFAKGLLKQLRT